MYSEATRIINTMICDRMSEIENLTNKMFHEYDKDLEFQCVVAMDSDKVAVKNTIIARLNTIIDDLNS